MLLFSLSLSFLSSRQIFVLRTNLLFSGTRVRVPRIFEQYATIRSREPPFLCIRVNNSYCSNSKLTCFSNKHHARNLNVQPSNKNQITDRVVAFSDRNTVQPNDPLPRYSFFLLLAIYRNPLFSIKKIPSFFENFARWNAFLLPNFVPFSFFPSPLLFFF